MIVVRAGAVPALGALLALVASTPVFSQANNACDQPGEAPDMILGDMADVKRWGSLGGITAFSLGSTTCNIGTCQLNFAGTLPNHPVLAQNLYRLEYGRFEQIGQSWIKHPVGAAEEPFCGACLPVGDGGNHLGVQCSDVYNADRNGLQGRMGFRSDVNPHTGAVSTFGLITPGANVIDRRLQVATSDLDPAHHPGARYFAELHAIGADDAVAGQDMNNWSYREVSAVPSGAGIGLAPVAPSVVGRPALTFWSDADPSVLVTQASRPGDGIIRIATKVTWMGNGTWLYEYAVHNLNSQAAPIALSVPLPPGTTVTSTGFHAVRYHSGDPQDNALWARLVGASAVKWQANTLVLGETLPNALRWGTIANFRFVCDAAPGLHAVTLGFSVAPHPPFETSLSIGTQTPSRCDDDGVCDPGETCASCAADCAQQGGGSGCCGNASCEAGESAAACVADCGTALPSEMDCGDRIDGDRDGLVDCFDSDCCAAAVCGAFDLDGDGRAVCDCDDARADAWATPVEVPGLIVRQNPSGGTLLLWGSGTPGGSADQYEAFRSTDPADFAAGAVCLSTIDTHATFATEPDSPLPGGVFFYLVRARNACPSGVGPLGSSSAGVPHTAPPCF